MLLLLNSCGCFDDGDDDDYEDDDFGGGGVLDPFATSFGTAVADFLPILLLLSSILLVIKPWSPLTLIGIDDDEPSSLVATFNMGT